MHEPIDAGSGLPSDMQIVGTRRARSPPIASGMMAYLKMHSHYAGELRKQQLRSFDDFMAAPGRSIGRHRNREVVLLQGHSFEGYLKREIRVAWRDRFANWRAGYGLVSKSRREWMILHELAANHFVCPTAVAVGEEGGRAFLLVRAFPDSIDLYAYLADGYCTAPADRVDFARSLGRTLAAFHQAGFNHPDLYAKHVFVNVKDQTITFIDFQRTRRRRNVGWRERCRDIAAFHSSLSYEWATTGERLAFLRAYFAVSTPGATVRRWMRRKIIQRTAQLLRRRKIQEMRRQRPADFIYTVEALRLRVGAQDILVTAGGA
jgi:tRNA A-37 threonylcarbamoyl transferase component Bud32